MIKRDPFAFLHVDHMKIRDNYLLLSRIQKRIVPDNLVV